ncbi:hypothetical protein FRC05_002434 [Tulasnella sp. 425]|nr:hypothetical protein FRC05_002434 [Tulasnella sp. 425]
MWGPVPRTPRINPSSSPTGEPECGICADQVLLLNDGSLSTLDASSAKRPLGIALPCHGMVIGHTYCFSCISEYLKTALSEATFRTVFPIRCPECTYIIMDQQAERILDRRDLEGLWHWAKLFEEVQTSYHPESVRAPSEKRNVPSVGKPSASAASLGGTKVSPLLTSVPLRFASLTIVIVVLSGQTCAQSAVSLEELLMSLEAEH